MSIQKAGMGQTLLSFAAEFGGVEVVKLFLSRSDVGVDLGDGKSRTPLSHAASRWDKMIVQL
ncbi:hypothetical protein SERLA73DRAFT_138725 [Serpula lacrymans var. lacrymans S7.3]|uniref:Uncharacterized protein n=2 Tax=Serpula lacrymans var. lacrymans TaxID=341189 RepID=F8PZM2_SERL3|nr:uncharacterized protein SERLADRAFT_392516 [Serpula lacrymans var. lacrymans S7.9]EGN98344.1 hypothetical protein SERLA73DRAFT_138725 [Serpula lacrymans var. lacrymans S7.3]EGO23906.1 hypothetical protein SERLADRAFT_392516 [Serpula lacrymans var. lacrymans S7.9]